MKKQNLIFSYENYMLKLEILKNAARFSLLLVTLVRTKYTRTCICAVILHEIEKYKIRIAPRKAK